MRTRRLTLMASLAAIALTIFIAESQIPPIVPLPGIKLGLANIITLVAMSVLSRRDAGLILAVRIILGSIITGSVSSLIFSLSGGILAYAVMAAIIGLFPEELIWVVSTLGAMAHNAGQLIAAVFITKTPGILVYAPALLASSIVTGVFTGLASMLLIQSFKRISKK
ncbi:MAG TPA: Gx transporter family protein [Clostridiales bacterium]|nr:Gx transporter family protein [Clostridiales bacterium]